MSATSDLRFESSVAFVDGCAVVTVTGELDMSTVDQFCVSLEQGLAGAANLTIDLTAATFMDSAAVDALVNAHHSAQAAQAAFVIRRAPGIIRKVLAFHANESGLPVDTCGEVFGQHPG